MATTPPPKARIPGSQVAPKQKPLFRNATTATTHSKVPLAQATEGKRYRVRDKDWAALWGEDLPYYEAIKLKDQVVGSRQSKTARVEEMTVEEPAWFVAARAQAEADLENPPPPEEPPPPDPQLELLRAKALAASQAEAVKAQARADAARAKALARPVPRDKTVAPAVFRATSIPRDKTIKVEPRRTDPAPLAEEPEPMDSPLKVAMEPEELPDDLLGLDDLSDIMGDVGGGASEADIARAKAERDAEIAAKKAGQ